MRQEEYQAKAAFSYERRHGIGSFLHSDCIKKACSILCLAYFWRDNYNAALGAD